MAQDTSQIREQIAQERVQLGETVKALAEKADVKGRAQKKASESVEHVQQKAGQVAEQVEQKAAQVDERIRAVAPDPVVSGVRSATTMARRRPVPVATALLLILAGAILGWRLRRSD
jgi:hypothetical protein